MIPSTLISIVVLATLAVATLSDLSPQTFDVAKMASRNHRRHHRKHKHHHHHHHHKGQGKGNSTNGGAAGAVIAAVRVGQPKVLPHHVAKTKPVPHGSGGGGGGVGGVGVGVKGMVKNGIAIGFLPDDGSGGGTPEQMSSLNAALSRASATYGYYSQVISGTPYDGSQLLARMNDIKSSGAIFQPAVMPIGGWGGLRKGDNGQAIAIAKVMQLFVDQGIEVWLRFAHEVNYYQTDGTYQGGIYEFKEGWSEVAKAVRIYAPKVKMWFTPNVADLSQYDAYYPDDHSTVDLIGIDYYPQTGSPDFLTTMKPFHDKYASSTTKFAIGETGLGAAAPLAVRIAWFTDATSPTTVAGLPNYIALSWFNYMKGYDFRLIEIEGDSVTRSYLASS